MCDVAATMARGEQPGWSVVRVEVPCPVTSALCDAITICFVHLVQRTRSNNIFSIIYCSGAGVYI